MIVLELDRPTTDSSEFVEQQSLIVLESEVPMSETDAVDAAMAVVKEQGPSRLKKYLTAAALGISVVGGAVAHPPLAAMAAVGALSHLAAPRLKKLKHGKLISSMVTLGSVALAAPLAMNAFASPAHAIIFRNAQTAFTTSFPLAGAVIPIIFNIFRAVYITYLLYSAISIWTSYQRDEDWMSAAKAPIIVFVAAELTDAVAQMIFV